MAKNKINLEDFVQSSRFTDDFSVEIFKELVTTYKKESPRQHLIRAVIMLWERKYPAELRYHKKAMEQRRETRANQFAANKDEDMRLLMSFPASLWNRLGLMVKDPDFLHESSPITKEEKLEKEWVIKNFPEFVVAEKY